MVFLEPDIALVPSWLHGIDGPCKTACSRVPDYGEVWFNERALTNIFSLAELRKKYHVTYDSNKEEAFIMHFKEGKPAKFTQSPNGLYYRQPTYNVKQQASFIETVDENKQFYTDRQFREAKKARELYQALGTPSI